MSSRIVFKSVDGTRTVIQLNCSAQDTEASFWRALGNSCPWYVTGNTDGSIECVNLDNVTYVRITEVPDDKS